MDKTTIDQHIEVRPERCGGKPCIRGTRIRVWDIHVWHNLSGHSPEKIVTTFPQLTAGDVQAALAYYIDHRDKIETQAAEDEAFVNCLKADPGPRRSTQLRNKPVKGKQVHDDSLPS